MLWFDWIEGLPYENIGDMTLTQYVKKKWSLFAKQYKRQKETPKGV